MKSIADGGLALPESFLEANLRWVAARDPEMADRLRATEPRELIWEQARSGLPVALLPGEGRPVALASRYDPGQEAQRLADSVDLSQAACLVILGLGLGYHVQQLVERISSRGLLIVYEPDTALLRAILEHTDQQAWLRRPNVLLFDGETDQAALTRALDAHAAVVTQGTRLVTHPPTRQRQSEALSRFGDMFTEVLAYCRTIVATALVNAARTCHNLASNLDRYAAGATIAELHEVTRGYPAVCVGAGPSLVKNVDLLRDPQVRQNIVLIAVQTALKPLLERGIRPDFVTALDYSPICKRFYEGLPELPDVTLVCEPKANAVILDAFPGPIRVTASDFCDLLLGDLKRPIPRIPSGATVAHLSYYLARHLGCDPVIFIGQDLGFSDGLYYAPGTAVHQVWSAELNPFMTLENMEWTRVVRMKGHLRRSEDVHGRPMFIDEQMATYLKQFERDFAQAQAEGLKVIDATEGGSRKAHSEVMTLREALNLFATRPVPPLPLPPLGLEPDRLRQVRQKLQRHQRQVADLRRTSQQTVTVLEKMRQHQRDPSMMEKLFAQLRPHQDRVSGELSEAFALVEAINTMGAFKRHRADRTIEHQTTDPLERQRLQLERDLENLSWLIQACDEVLDVLASARKRIERPVPQLASDAGRS